MILAFRSYWIIPFFYIIYSCEIIAQEKYISILHLEFYIPRCIKHFPISTEGLLGSQVMDRISDESSRETLVHTLVHDDRQECKGGSATPASASRELDYFGSKAERDRKETWQKNF